MYVGERRWRKVIDVVRESADRKVVSLHRRHSRSGQHLRWVNHRGADQLQWPTALQVDVLAQ